MLGDKLQIEFSLCGNGLLCPTKAQEQGYLNSLAQLNTKQVSKSIIITKTVFFLSDLEVIDTHEVILYLVSTL